MKSILDFLNFQTMITPIIIKLIYISGQVIIILGGLAYVLFSSSGTSSPSKSLFDEDGSTNQYSWGE